MAGTSRRAGPLALCVTFSAGIHAGLAPEHLKEMPPLGYAFIAAAVMGSVLAGALVSRPDDRARLQSRRARGVALAFPLTLPRRPPSASATSAG